MIGNATYLEIAKFVVILMALIYSLNALRRGYTWYSRSRDSTDPNAGDILIMAVRLDISLVIITFLMTITSFISLILPTAAGHKAYDPVIVVANGLSLLIGLVVLSVKLLNIRSINRVKGRLRLAMKEHEPVPPDTPPYTTGPATR